MKNYQIPKNLAEIAQDYPIILIDNCALRYTREEFKIKKASFIKETDCSDKIIEYLKQGVSCYIAPFAIDKLRKSIFVPNKNNKPEIKQVMKARQRLIDNFQGRKKVIKLNHVEKAFYEVLYQKYKNDKELLARDIGEISFDLLVQGRILSEKNPCVLISNNFKIFNLLKKIQEKENFSEKKLGFFYREGLDEFEKPSLFKY